LNSAASLEIEIQGLLEHYQTADLAADALIKKYEEQKLNLIQFEALATFLLYCGFYATLTDLILRKLDDGSQIPWGHFAEALFLSTDSIDPIIKEAFYDGADEQDSLPHLSRTHYLDSFDAEMIRLRQVRRQNFTARAEKKKLEMIQEIEVLRSQGLHKEEDLLIQSLAKLFPADSTAFELRAGLREKLAHDFMAKRVEKPRSEIFFPIFETRSEEEEKVLSDIEKSMQESLQASQALATDFALAHMMWENHEAALRILEQAPESPARDWLKVEALLRGRRFAELLEELLIVESKYSDDAETVFAVHYLRAQALWGLDQKQMAIDILEGMVEARPHYRAAHSLLREWKEDFA
jgi:hypothetical protein